MSNTTMNSLMNSIDTIKQKITDAEYKELCDKMMELNNQRKNAENYYRVWYVTIKTIVVEEDEEDDDNSKAITRYFPKFENKVIKLRAETVENNRRIIDEEGRCFMDYKVLGVEIQDALPVISDDGVNYICSTNSRDYAVTRIDDLV